MTSKCFYLSSIIVPNLLALSSSSDPRLCINNGPSFPHCDQCRRTQRSYASICRRTYRGNNGKSVSNNNSKRSQKCLQVDPLGGKKDVLQIIIIFFH